MTDSPLRPPSPRQPQPRHTPRRAFPVLQRQFAAVSFGDLPAQNQADSRSAGLGSEEGHEQVRRAGGEEMEEMGQPESLSEIEASQST